MSALKLQLVWKPFSGEAELAMLGDVIIAHITPMSVKPGTWAYAVDGVDMKWVAKGRGQVKGRALAKRAVEEAWHRWIRCAGLDCGG